MFVSSAGHSSLIFATVVESEKIEDWITCHVEMHDFYGGVFEWVVPDNLKSAVTKRTRDEIILNPLQWYADHGITLHLNRKVVDVDRRRRVVVADTKGRVLYAQPAQEAAHAAVTHLQFVSKHVQTACQQAAKQNANLNRKLQLHQFL